MEIEEKKNKDHFNLKCYIVRHMKDDAAPLPYQSQEAGGGVPLT